MSRIGIAGAGIAGRLLAWQLARLGHQVEVFDPAPDAGAPDAAGAHGAAAFTAAGMLSPLAELDGAPLEIAARGWRSLDLWPGIVAALGPQYRTPSLFRRNGSLLVTHPRDAGAAQRVLARMKAAQVKQARLRQHDPADDDNPSTLQIRETAHDAAREKLQQGLPQALTHDALHALEPALLPGLHGWLLPSEGQVDATRVLPALCAEAPGVHWHWGTRVNEVEPNALHVSGRLPARFDVAVDTRGLGARPTLALRGVRGELLWLHAPGLELRRPVRCVHARHRVYLVPRHGDIVIVGATEIDSEDKSPVSVRSTIELLSAAHAIVPQLAEARIVRLDTHLRPATPDQAPLLHCERGLIRINGLFRHGFLLAPALIEEALMRTGLMASAHRREASHA
ncbi:MAG: FAD-dependent oxidoreductase [Betaproteobacteria bacterium]